jgi:hypothetical protein
LWSGHSLIVRMSDPRWGKAVAKLCRKVWLETRLAWRHFVLRNSDV